MARAALVVLLAGGVGAVETRYLLLLPFMARTALVVLLAGGVEAVVKGCLLSLLFRAKVALVVLLAGGVEAVATQVSSSSSILQGQGSTGCAPGWRGGGSSDKVAFFPGPDWHCLGSWLVM
jgi:hypothetical protein